jgi:hypothetical protein
MAMLAAPGGSCAIASVQTVPGPSGTHGAPNTTESPAGKRSAAVGFVAGEGPALMTLADMKNSSPANSGTAFAVSWRATSASATTAVSSICELLDGSRSISGVEATNVRDSTPATSGLTAT